MFFTFGLVVGALGAGALMYYAQPTIKAAMAQMLNKEHELVMFYEGLVVKAKQIKADRFKYGA